MSLLRNIWRPNEGSKGPGAPGESVLTERLAELLGREAEDGQEGPLLEGSDQTDSASERPAENGGGIVITAPAPIDESVSTDVVRTAPSIPPVRRAPTPMMPTRLTSSSGSAASSSAPLSSIARATEQALERLKSAEEQIEAELRTRVEDYGHALENSLGSAAQRGPTPDKPLEEAANRFRAEAREWFDDARRELRDQLEASRASLEAELKKNHEELLGIARQKIESMALATLETKAQASSQAERAEVTRWLKEQAEVSREQAEAGARALAQATEQALARLRAVEEKIEASFRNQVEDYRRAVESAVAELEHKGISQAKFQHAAEELQRVTEQALDRTAKRIEERTAQAVNQLSEKAAAAERSLDGAARASLEAALQEQRERWANAWQEQSRAAQQSLARSAEESIGQLEEARKTAETRFLNAAKEQSRRVAETVEAELRTGKVRQDLVADAAAEIERTARELVGRSASELRQQSDATLSGLSTTLRDASRKFIEEVQQRLDAAGRAWFDSAGQTVQEEYRARIAAWVEEQTQATRRQTEAAGQTVARLAQEAAARLETVARESEATFRGRAEEQQKRWLEAAIEEARKNGIGQKFIDRTLGELDKNAVRFLEKSAERLEQQAEQSRNAITAEMEASARKLLDGVEASLEQISRQQRGRLAQWWEERQQAARHDAEATAETVSRAGQQAAAQLRSVQAEIEAELKSRSREQQSRLVDAAVEEMRRSGTIERAITEASVSLRGSANEILVRSNEQLREQAEASRLALDNHAQASRRGLAEELARMAEQAQLSVENSGKAVTEDYRRQLSVWWEERTQSARRESEDAASGISRAARQAAEQLVSMRKDMENDLRAGLENYRKGLREAAAEEIRRQGFQKEALDAISSELTKTAHELAQRSTKELQHHIDNTLAGIEEKFKATRQNFLDDTQKKLAEMNKTSMDMTTGRFHELITKNVQELEQEQEQWLQRKREAIWLDVNKLSPPQAGKHAPLQKNFLTSTAREEKSAGASPLLGRMLAIFAVIAMAAALTAVFVRMAPQKTISMQLPSDPPTGFVDMNPNWSPKRRAQELQLGQAYWMIAINDLQHKYPFNTVLPATPPPEFKVDQNGLKDDAATRTRYWSKFRALWTSRGAWQQTVTSSGGPIGTTIDWLRLKFFATAQKTPAPAD